MTGTVPIDRAVVLAAGIGSRIRPASSDLPKPLTPLNGRALISYTLDALAENGVEDVVVVTGYRERLLRAALAEGVPFDVTFVSNSDYELGASTSLAAARSALSGEPFLLVMADHALAPGLLSALVDQARPTGATVAADYASRPRFYEEEATKLEIDGADEARRVRSIGKHLETWQALDAGAFVCTSDVWTALEDAPHGAELSDVFGRLADRGLLYAADVSGEFWYDVDTPGDLAMARRLLAATDGGA